MARLYEHDSESLGFIKDGVFPGRFSNYYYFRSYSAPCSYITISASHHVNSYNLFDWKKPWEI
jgi:hypothetical protein